MDVTLEAPWEDWLLRLIGLGLLLSMTTAATGLLVVLVIVLNVLSFALALALITAHYFCILKLIIIICTSLIY